MSNNMTDSIAAADTIAERLNSFLARGPYVGYCYSYPHKTAYRRLPVRSLRDVWQDEARDSLFLYVHVPFCEFRCGFCNLFTLSQPDADLPGAWLKTFERQAKILKQQILEANFGQLAIGGGTPSYLNTDELELLFNVLQNDLNVNGSMVPASMEVSPATVDQDKLRLMKDFGVDRVSMGVQSFDGNDVGSMGRPQKLPTVMNAIELIEKFDFPIMNLDLIYGATGQTEASWLDSVKRSIACQPAEIYLYPLYVREKTGLAKRGSQTAAHAQQRLSFYRSGRDELLGEGYEQVSMRMFRKPVTMSSHKADYRCQEDGMVGLGCGARSYTKKLHYGTEYAVRQKSVARIISDFVSQSDQQLSQVEFGFELDGLEIRRRHLILSLFLVEGISLHDYELRFGSCAMEDFPQLLALLERNLAVRVGDLIRLSEDGLAWSDTIGPWLYSAEVEKRMEAYPWTDA